MAERQKGKPFAFGGQTLTTVTHTNSSDAILIDVVIENVAPVITSDKAEFRDGDGAVDGVIFTNERTTLSIEFYVSDTNITISEGTAGNNRDFKPGDKLTFNDATFLEIDDGSHSFLIDEITKTRNFGDVRKISLSMTEYENDVTADATA
jgi:hypothetical protein